MKNKYEFFCDGSVFHKLDKWIFKINPFYLEAFKALVKRKDTILAKSIIRNYSDIVTLYFEGFNKYILIKKIKFQKAADYWRRYIGKSQGFREFSSSFKLLSIQVPCPLPICCGVNLSPFGPYESIYVSDYIENTETGIDFFIREKNLGLRQKFLSIVAENLAEIHNHGLFHKDSRLGNILFLNTTFPEIFWIDNDLKKMKSRYERYEKLALNRFKKTLRKDIISSEEWNFFIEQYFYKVKNHRCPCNFPE
ncbi:MAG: hypothetical protein JW786_09250 [Desulfobacterales bacterium]|nr:hypothetical protein [Desulfobacterales bacterium]